MMIDTVTAFQGDKMEKEEVQKIFNKDINSTVAVQGNEIKHMQRDMDE